MNQNKCFSHTELCDLKKCMQEALGKIDLKMIDLQV